MRYFDLHCDTITQCFTQNKDLTENDLQIDLKRAEFLDAYTQCYAVWLPDQFRGQAAFERFFAVATYLSQEIEKNSNSICWQNSVDNLSQNPCQAVLTVENASALGGNIENVEVFRRLGVKLCSLTWNGENELGRGVMSPGNTGITPFGREVVAHLEKNEICIDISHASPELFWDVISIAERPVVATHSNAKHVCAHPRNLTDQQFEAIKVSEGLVGLNLYRGFLNDDSQKASYEDILRHTEHFLNLGGEDILAFGADWDGSARRDFVATGIEAVAELYEMFCRYNYSETLIDKIFYKNAADFFERQKSH